MYHSCVAVGHLSCWNGMGSKGERKALCWLFAPLWACCGEKNKHNLITLILLSQQAQIVLLIFLLVAIVNVFVGTFIPVNTTKESQGIFNYNCKQPSSHQCIFFTKTFDSKQCEDLTLSVSSCSPQQRYSQRISPQTLEARHFSQCLPSSSLLPLGSWLEPTSLAT